MPDLRFASLLPDDCVVEASGTRIGRWDVTALVSAFGTPLYVYDAETVRNEAQRTLDAFARLHTRVRFAAKACSTIGVLRIVQHAGLDMDAVSEGEMVAGLRAGFTANRIHLHGNCKSDRELEFAVRHDVRSIIVDSAAELTRIESVCQQMGKMANVAVRLSLEVGAETHPHLRTSGLASKFGIEVGMDEEAVVIDLLARSPHLRMTGLHCHAGSQITDAGVYSRIATQLIAEAARFAEFGVPVPEINIGGGWAVPYTPGDLSLSPEDVATAVAEPFRRVPHIRLGVEPGRALIARAALAVYRVGAVKFGANGTLVAVDGGMGDNPRPSLYGTEYTAFLAQRPTDAVSTHVDIVGRFCEGGDVLATGVPLPEVRSGDIVCIPMSGAYQLSMASTYNLVPRPAAVMVDGRDARLMTKRETVSALLSRELGYSDWKLD